MMAPNVAPAKRPVCRGNPRVVRDPRLFGAAIHSSGSRLPRASREVLPRRGMPFRLSPRTAGVENQAHSTPLPHPPKCPICRRKAPRV
jgi:hypothetical protein